MIGVLVKALNLESFTITPNFHDVVSNYRKITYAFDTPQVSTNASYYFTYRLVRANNTIVTLDGQGADELQGGYKHYLQNYVANEKLRRGLEIYKVYGIDSNSKKNILLGIFGNILKKLQGERIALKFMKLTKNERNIFNSFREELYENHRTNLINLLHYGDRGSMINSVEARFPFLDYRMVEFWFNLPDIYKINNGYLKYLSRIAMRSKIPDLTLKQKRKMGWEIPNQLWVKMGLTRSTKFSKVAKDFVSEIQKSYKTHRYLRFYNNDNIWRQDLRYYNLALWYSIFFEKH